MSVSSSCAHSSKSSRPQSATIHRQETHGVAGLASENAKALIPQRPSSARQREEGGSSRCSASQVPQRPARPATAGSQRQSNSGAVLSGSATAQQAAAAVNSSPRDHHKPKQKHSSTEQQLYAILRTQLGIVRSVFREVDKSYDGFAPKPQLLQQLMNSLFIAPLIGADAELRQKWEDSLSNVLDICDPDHTGQVEFGRLTRLIRASATGEAEQGTTRDVDAELRRRFRGVRSDNKLLTRRLESEVPFERMATTARTSSILGDSGISMPWAMMGDDARMDHILGNVDRERTKKLEATMMAFADKVTADGRPALSYPKFLAALRTYDPFVHDAEVLQYYLCITKDEEDYKRQVEARTSKHRKPVSLAAARKGKLGYSTVKYHQAATSNGKPNATLPIPRKSSFKHPSEPTGPPAPNIPQPPKLKTEKPTITKAVATMDVVVGSGSTAVIPVREFLGRYCRNVTALPGTRNSAEFTLKWNLSMRRG